ncbi:hypothetical protein ACFUOZ_00610 [Paenarthrobacter sp. NPDC057355]|uniref:hypothetical protein n=1 Tax=Paenarthrobacter sp. NPDC057355 TaxID=3346105 RepID=UPI003642B703
MNVTKPLAGLTSYGMTRDEAAGKWVPCNYDEPGVIHAVRPAAAEPKMKNPYFIEETQDYRAALCGALVKVIMPNTFKPCEDGACPECIEELEVAEVREVLVTGPQFTSPLGDSWYSHGNLKNPAYKRRREAEREQK